VKILLTTFTFAPEGNGVAEVVTAHARGLAELGHEVEVITAFNETRKPKHCPGVTVHQFKAFEGGRALKPGEIPGYQALVGQFAGDIIVSHCWGAWSTDCSLPVIAGHKAIKIFVSHGYSAHKWYPYRRFPWGIPSWLQGLPYVLTTIKALGIYDHIVFLSSRTDWGRYFDGRLVKWLRRPSSSVIPNGTYPQPSRENGALFRAELGINGFLALHVGGYYDRKNQPLALRAFVKAGLERGTLVFVGNEINEYARSLRELNVRINPDPERLRVLFLEKQSRDQIRAAYSAADLFILPSKEETQPLVVLDAMAAGTPFISTDVGSVSELPGGLIAKNEPEMAALISRLAREMSLRTRLGNEGFNAASTRYNWNAVIDQYESLFVRLQRDATQLKRGRRKER
jgi:glycosyltransferase involved in cell wall biosynthesis